MQLHRKIAQWLVIGLFTIGIVRGGDVTGMAFLKLPVDARSAAMGEVSVAFSGQASAVFQNPAALAFNEKKSLTFMHNAYLADIAQEFAAFQFANGTHNLALALNVVDIPGIEIRGARPTVQPDGTTDAINLAFALAYARRYHTDWSFGLTAKYLFEKYYLTSATGWALDFGLQRHNFLTQGLTWGLVLQNVGKMNKLKDEATPLPLIARVGMNYMLPVEWLKGQPFVAAEWEQLLNSDDGAVRLGFELPMLQTFTLRLGTILTSPKVRYSLGFGLRYHRYQINYAFSSYPFDLGNSHRFSLNVVW
jgi:hypothetical protein